MSSQINKRKPLNRSSPPLVFSSSSLFSHPRGLAVTFPEDKVVTKVTHTRTLSFGKHLSLVGWAEPRRGSSGKTDKVAAAD